MQVSPAAHLQSERFHNSSVEQRCSMNPPLTRGPCHCPQVSLTPPPPHALSSSHTAFPDSETHQALSHLGVSVWNTSPTSDLGTSVTSPGKPSLTLRVYRRCSLFPPNAATGLCSSKNLISIKSSLCFHVSFCPFLCKGGGWPAMFTAVSPTPTTMLATELLSDYLSDE